MNSTNNSTTTLNVPNNYLDQIINLINQLNMDEVNNNNNMDEEDNNNEDNNNINEEDNNMNEEDIIGDFIVTKVTDHKILNNIWFFKLKFKGFNTLEWIPEEDCNCTELINNYLNLKNIKTYYCYCRVSSKQQDQDNTLSLDQQEIELVNEATKLGATRIKVLKTVKSAYTSIPKNLLYINDNINKGDYLLVYYIDRLSRNIVKYLTFLDNMKNKGIVIRSVHENLNYDSNNLDFIQHMLDANKVSKLMSIRAKKTIETRISRGDNLGNPPFGKKILKTDNSVKFVENENELHILNIILKSSLNIDDLVDFLNNKKLFNRNNKKWTNSSIIYHKNKNNNIINNNNINKNKSVKMKICKKRKLN